MVRPSLGRDRKASLMSIVSAWVKSFVVVGILMFVAGSFINLGPWKPWSEEWARWVWLFLSTFGAIFPASRAFVDHVNDDLGL